MDAAFASIPPQNMPVFQVPRPVSPAVNDVVYLDADGCIPLLPDNLTPFGDVSATTPWTLAPMGTLHPLDDPRQTINSTSPAETSPATAAGPSSPKTHLPSDAPPAIRPTGSVSTQTPFVEIPLSEIFMSASPLAQSPFEEMPLGGMSGIGTSNTDMAGPEIRGYGLPNTLLPGNAMSRAAMPQMGEIPLAPAQSMSSAKGTLSPSHQPIFAGMSASEPQFANGLTGRGSILLAGKFSRLIRSLLLQIGHRLAFVGIVMLMVTAAMLLSGRWSYYPYVLTGGFISLLLASLFGCVAAACKTPLGKSRLESMGLFLVMLSLAAVLAVAMIYDLKIPLHELIPAIPL